MDRAQRIKNLRETFAVLFGGRAKPRVFAAPGRVNLIGEHTDYNGGFVLPMCIDRDILVAAAPNKLNLLRLRSLDDATAVDCPVADIQYTPANGWANYPLGVAHVLRQCGYPLVGGDLLFSGNVPVGAGLSSSAALEVAGCLALAAIGGIDLRREEVPFLCCEAENTFVGVPCGIMDQFVITHGRRGQVVFLDCRSMQFAYLPWDNPDYVLVITDSGKRRRLVDSAYDERKKQCAEGVDCLRRYLGDIRQLRDVTLRQFPKYRSALPADVQKRCEHVLRENDRVLRAKELLRQKMFRQFGALMNESHCSLRDLYEVSCPELDTIVEASLAVPGVLGSRMTGAGFGGCTVTLVERSSVDELMETVAGEYGKRFVRSPEFYLCNAEQGAGEIALDETV